MVLLKSNTKTPNRTAPKFSLLGVDGLKYTLNDFVNKKGLAVIFTCNHCPYAIASWPIIIELAEKYTDIGFICINSNDENKVQEDSFENMKKLSQKNNFKFPYVYDEDQSVAIAFDAQCTPDNYLFKNNQGNFELFYHGRFNDNWQYAIKVTEKNFEDNIILLLNNKTPSEKQIPSIGCSIKWK